MQNTLKKMKPIIAYIIITLLLMGILGTVSVLIQGILLVIMLPFMIMTFWINPIMVTVIYFKIKKKIDDSSRQGYTDMEWALIKLNIILAQLAGVTIAHSLALCLDKDFFLMSIGGFGLRSADIGMGITLVIILSVTSIKEVYQLIKMLSCNKKEKKEIITEDKGTIKILTALIVVMAVLTFTGFLLGKKLERYPSLEELVPNKAEYILKHKEYIETIRQYIEDLDYEKIVTGRIQKVGDLDVSYDMNNNSYSKLRMDAEDVLKDIGLKDINIVGYGEIIIEFDAKTYEVKKIYIPVKYTQTGIKNLNGGGLEWYCSDYTNRLPGFILDDNWQIDELAIAGH